MRAPSDGASIARLAALLADPTRAGMCLALLDGRPGRPASSPPPPASPGPRRASTSTCSWPAACWPRSGRAGTATCGSPAPGAAQLVEYLAVQAGPGARAAVAAGRHGRRGAGARPHLLRPPRRPARRRGPGRAGRPRPGRRCGAASALTDAGLRWLHDLGVDVAALRRGSAAPLRAHLPGLDRAPPAPRRRGRCRAVHAARSTTGWVERGTGRAGAGDRGRPPGAAPAARPQPCRPPAPLTRVRRGARVADGSRPTPSGPPATCCSGTASDYETARRRVPVAGAEHFNFGLDWFDVLAAEQPDVPAAVDRRRRRRRGPADLRRAVRAVRRSWRLAAAGGRRPRRPACCSCSATSLPLWEVMLACIKLGAVVIPATTLLGPRDLADRVERGEVQPRRHRVRRHREVRRRARRAGPGSPSAPPVAGWLRYDDSLRAPRDVHAPRSRPGPTRRCCSTSPAARRRGRSWSSTPTRPTRSGTCRRRTGSGCSPATCTSTSRRPGWAKHAWSNVFAPWIAGATAFVVNQPRFDAGGAARHDGPVRRDDVLRAADGVADARAGGPARPTRCRRCARWSAPASRSTPR